MLVRRLLLPLSAVIILSVVTAGPSVAAAPVAQSAVTAPASLRGDVFVGASLATTMVTIDAQPTTGVINEPESMAGLLSFSDGASTNDLWLDVTEQSPDGGTTPLPQQNVNVFGVYTFYTPSLTEYGTYTFTASYPGDATHSAGQASVQVTVPRPGTSTSVTTSVAKLIYGRTVTVTAHESAPIGSTVTIRRKVNGVASVVATGTTDSNASFSVTTHPAENTIYWATFAGDASHAPSASPAKTVLVQPVITAGFSGAYGVNAGYHLFHYHASCATSGTSCPLFTEHFTPSYPGHVVYAVLQVHEARGWVSLGSWKGTLGPKSSAVFKLRYGNASVIGADTRVEAVWKGDSRRAAIAWGYWYFRITH